MSAPQPEKRGGLPPHLTPGNPGNSGGKKGRSGAKPNWLKRFAKAMLKHPGTRESVRKILHSKGKHPGFTALFKELGTRAYGKPTETVDLNHKVTLEDLVNQSFTKE